MKKSFLVLLVVIVLSAGSYYAYGAYFTDSNSKMLEPLKLSQDGCSLPIKYKVGDIDDKFNVSKSEIKRNALKAEKIWEESFDKNLFQYTTSSNFKINLVYDERQLTTDQKESFKNNLDKTKTELEKIEKEHKELSQKYDSKLEIYNKKSKEYQKQADAYNQKVNKWNQEGGAPEEKYNELQKQKQELQTKEQELVDMEKELDRLSKQINNLSEQSKKLVEKHNEKVQTYRDRFGKKRKFNAGDYKDKRINIYQFRTGSDLRLKLAHEFGHALGLGHVKNDPESIMYEYMDEQNLDSLHLTEEDIKSLKRKCNFEI